MDVDIISRANSHVHRTVICWYRR